MLVWDIGLFGELLPNVLANLICAGVPLLVGFLVYWLRSRRQLRHFFGITERRSNVVQIRLSNLQVKPAGALGPMRISTGFVGPAIIAGEYEYAINLASAVQSRPLARALRVLAEPLGVATIDPPIMCRIDRSLNHLTIGDLSDPDAYRPVDFATDEALVTEIWRTLTAHSSFVLVGSPVYNVLTYYVLTHDEDIARVEFVESPEEPGHQASAIKIKNFPHGGVDHVFQRRVIDLGDGSRIFEEYFVLQKIANWNRTGTTIFICAGNSVAATAAALLKLADWRSLARDFGYGSFTTVYSLHTGDRELAVPGAPSAATLGAASRVWPPERLG